MPIDPDAFVALLKARLPADSPLVIPPPCLVDMQAEVVDYVEGESLSVRFPVLARYRNPLGFMQGGFIAAALDNTLGPFSYLIAPPSLTSQLNTGYLRPVPPDETHIVCTARLVERTAKTLYLEGVARNTAGKPVAIAQSVCQIQ